MKQMCLWLSGIFQIMLSAGGSQNLIVIHEKTYRKFTLVPSKLRVYSPCTAVCKTLQTNICCDITSNTNSLLHLSVTNQGKTRNGSKAEKKKNSTCEESRWTLRNLMRFSKGEVKISTLGSEELQMSGWAGESAVQKPIWKGSGVILHARWNKAMAGSHQQDTSWASTRTNVTSRRLATGHSLLMFLRH